jgi:hypothetical protein
MELGRSTPIGGGDDDSTSWMDKQERKNVDTQGDIARTADQHQH